MLYLDNGATSFQKPPAVKQEMLRAMEQCANPGRGGYAQAMRAAEVVYACREVAGKLFHYDPERVVFTANCTHGLNLAIHTLVKPGAKVVISGFEHNAVTRPLHGLRAQIRVAGGELFNWENTLEAFEQELKTGPDAAVFTHVSNVFGYILPVEQMAALCRQYGVPFVVDAAQSAGSLPVEPDKWGADFVAMPGHKGLLGPQGTGILLCGRMPVPLLRGGTGSVSLRQEMPDFLPDGAEAGTVNVPGIAGLKAGMEQILRDGPETIGKREQLQVATCAKGMKRLGFRVFSGEHQSGTVSFVPSTDCQQMADRLGERGVAVRAGLHCAPLAHRTAGTLETGTVRVSYGYGANDRQTAQFLKILSGLT